MFDIHGSIICMGLIAVVLTDIVTYIVSQDSIIFMGHNV